MIVERLDPADPVVGRDRERLAAVREARAVAAQNYFREHAAEWDRIRKLHAADEAVEQAIVKALGDKPFRSLLDLGTGTGRMLELFGAADRARARHRYVARHAAAGARAAGARRPASLQRAAGRHLRPVAAARFLRCRSSSIRCCTYLDDGARAIREAARVLAPSGRLLIVDFAPHDLEFLREEHAHRRLGFAPETMSQWLAAAGLDVTMHKSIAPERGTDGKIAVSLWLAQDRRLRIAGRQEVA